VPKDDGAEGDRGLEQARSVSGPYSLGSAATITAGSRPAPFGGYPVTVPGGYRRLGARVWMSGLNTPDVRRTCRSRTCAMPAAPCVTFSVGCVRFQVFATEQKDADLARQRGLAGSRRPARDAAAADHPRPAHLSNGQASRACVDLSPSPRRAVVNVASCPPSRLVSWPMSTMGETLVHKYPRRRQRQAGLSVVTVPECFRCRTGAAGRASRLRPDELAWA